ncbi:MAG: hypothetical protein QOJ17_2510, partial [Rhodospirillaceae bacterium]|nr:hypothetical protein [Rhodospirillaceae bacterium]
MGTMELRHLRYFVAVAEELAPLLLSGHRIGYERQGCSRAIDVVLH